LGIISKQSSRTSLISFLGVAIGALSVMFVYPYDRNLYGYLQYIFSYAYLLSLLLSLGSLGLVVKFFPVFKTRQIKGFFLTILGIIATAVLLTSTVLILLKPFIFNALEFLDFRVEVISESQFTIYLLAVILVFVIAFNLHASNYNKTVIPTVLFELLHKMAMPLLILVSLYQMADTSSIDMMYLCFWFGVLILLGIYLRRIHAFELEKPQIRKIPGELKKEMGVYTIYSGLNQLGAGLVSKIDMIMIAALISFTDNGTYCIWLFMSNIIDIPIRSINQIASPVVSNSMEKNDLKDVNQIYKKSSLNALIFGIFLFGVLWSILPDLFRIMPKSDDMIKYIWVFFFLGLGKLVDMAFSVNGFIIIYSKYFRYNLIFLGILALTNIILNYFLIREEGILGAAIATAFSIISFNIIKLFFIWKKLNLWPFTRYTLLVVGLGVFIMISGYLAPDINNSYINVFLKSAILSLIFYAGLKLLKINAEVITQFEKIILLIYRKVLKK